MLVAPLELVVDLLQGVQVSLILGELASDDNLLSWDINSLSVGFVLQALVVTVDFSVLEAFSSSSSSEAEVLGRIASVGSAGSLAVSTCGTTGRDFNSTSDGFFSASNASFSAG